MEDTGEKLGAVGDKHFSQKMTNNWRLRSVSIKYWVVCLKEKRHTFEAGFTDFARGGIF